MIKIAKLHVDAVKQGIKKINYDKGKNITPVIVEDICSNNKALFFPGGGEGPWYGSIPRNNWIVFLPIILQFSGELGKFNFWGSCQYQPGETTYNREFAKLWRSFNVEINYNTNLIWSRLFKSPFQMTSAISGLLTSFQVRRNSDDWKGQQNCPE